MLHFRDLKIHRIPWLRRTCREVTHLLLEAEGRRLSMIERLALRVHMLICDTCPRFLGQVRLMRKALDRWHHYVEDEAPPKATDTGR